MGKYQNAIRWCLIVMIAALLILGLFFGIWQYHRSREETSHETETSTETSTSCIEIVQTSTEAVQTASTTVPVSETTPDSTTTITVTQTETTTVQTTTTVIPVESISLSFDNIQLYIGECAMPLVTMHPEQASDRTEIWSTSDNNVASVDYRGNITANSPGSCTIFVTASSNPDVKAQVEVTVLERPATEPPATEAPAALTYINGILIANKTYALPQDYCPGLDPTCKAQFDALSAAAAKEGLNIYLSSGFRSYDYQSRIYNNYVNLYGQEKADTFSARPGHSEHQTGLAIDVNTITDSFADTPEAAWLAAHAHEYGFIIRYPKGKEQITGYKYEPWHIRYLGVETATAVYESGLTLEEYLGITSIYQD